MKHLHPKLKSVMIMALMIGGRHAFAQRTRTAYDNDDYYFAMQMTAGHIFYPHHQGVIKINFPYEMKDLTGVTTAHQFSAELPFNLNRSSWQGAPAYFNFEIGNYSRFFSFTIGDIWSASYGVNLYLPIGNKPHCLVIKPSLGIGFAQASPFNGSGSDQGYFGTIPNANTTIDALGTTFNPSYTITSGNPSKSTSYNAKTLDVYYSDQNTLLIPSISIGSNNFERIFYWNFHLSYFLPIHRRQGVFLFQDQTNSRSEIWLNDKPSDLGISYNDGPIASTPKICDGLYAAFTIGINFPGELFTSGSKLKHLKNPGNVFVRTCPCKQKKHSHKTMHHSKNKNKKNTKSLDDYQNSRERH